MPAAAIALALAAAFLHALWNLLAARSADKEAALALAMTIGPLLAIPVAIATWHVEAAAIPYLVVSATLELVYLVLLGRGYRSADMSLIYPIARGMAPVFVLIAGALVLGQRVAPLSVAGIAVVAVGVVLVRGLGSGAQLRHVALALTLAAIIATYTLVDQQGLRYAAPIPYTVLITGIPGAILALRIAQRDGTGRLRRALTPSIGVAGLSGVVAYGFVLTALRLAPAALVAAVRESSVVIGTAMAALVLHEQVSRSRRVGVLVVVAGVALVVLG